MIYFHYNTRPNTTNKRNRLTSCRVSVEETDECISQNMCKDDDGNGILYGDHMARNFLANVGS